MNKKSFQRLGEHLVPKETSLGLNLSQTMTALQGVASRWRRSECGAWGGLDFNLSGRDSCNRTYGPITARLHTLLKQRLERPLLTAVAALCPSGLSLHLQVALMIPPCRLR